MKNDHNKGNKMRERRAHRRVPSVQARCKVTSGLHGAPRRGGRMKRHGQAARRCRHFAFRPIFDPSISAALSSQVLFAFSILHLVLEPPVLLGARSPRGASSSAGPWRFTCMRRGTSHPEDHTVLGPRKVLAAQRMNACRSTLPWSSSAPRFLQPKLVSTTVLAAEVADARAHRPAVPLPPWAIYY
jgi:hypothetical protein